MKRLIIHRLKAYQKDAACLIKWAFSLAGVPVVLLPWAHDLGWRAICLARGRMAGLAPTRAVPVGARWW